MAPGETSRSNSLRSRKRAKNSRIRHPNLHKRRAPSKPPPVPTAQTPTRGRPSNTQSYSHTDPDNRWGGGYIQQHGGHGFPGGGEHEFFGESLGSCFS